jgi:hypothetical protein
MKASPNAEVKAEVAGALWSLSEATDIKVLIAQAGSPAGMLAVMRGAGAIHCGWAGTLIIRRPPGAQQ